MCMSQSHPNSSANRLSVHTNCISHHVKWSQSNVRVIRILLPTMGFQIMYVSYSEDLHWRIVWLHVFLRMEASEVARFLHVCTRTVYRYAKSFNLTEKEHETNGPYPVLSESQTLF